MGRKITGSLVGLYLIFMMRIQRPRDWQAERDIKCEGEGKIVMYYINLFNIFGEKYKWKGRINCYSCYISDAEMH